MPPQLVRFLLAYKYLSADGVGKVRNLEQKQKLFIPQLLLLELNHLAADDAVAEAVLNFGNRNQLAVKRLSVENIRVVGQPFFRIVIAPFKLFKIGLSGLFPALFLLLLRLRLSSRSRSGYLFPALSGRDISGCHGIFARAVRLLLPGSLLPLRFLLFLCRHYAHAAELFLGKELIYGLFRHRLFFRLLLKLKHHAERQLEARRKKLLDAAFYFLSDMSADKCIFRFDMKLILCRGNLRTL